MCTDVSGGFVPRGVTVPGGRKGWRCVKAPLLQYFIHALSSPPKESPGCGEAFTESFTSFTFPSGWKKPRDFCPASQQRFTDCPRKSSEQRYSTP